MNKRILVFGSAGQVALSLRDVLADAMFVSRAELNFENPQSVETVLDRYSPTVVINPAAYTQVDTAESEPDVAMRVNAETPALIAKWCALRGASLIHYSTDYVYSGQGETYWKETDLPEPQNVYGRTKLAGERAIETSGCHHYILRTSWVFSPYGKNFLRTMLRLGSERENLRVVNDQIGSPTYAPDLALATAQLLNHQRFASGSGIYNICNSGLTSWCDFAKEIFRLRMESGAPLKIKSVDPIASSEYPTPAKRPLNSRMNTDKINTDFGIRLRAWQDATKDCVLRLTQS